MGFERTTRQLLSGVNVMACLSLKVCKQSISKGSEYYASVLSMEYMLYFSIF